MKIIDISNQKFGKLTAKYLLSKRHHNGGKMWYCECECGGNKSVELSALKKGHVKSCGCLRKDKRTKKQILDKRINDSRPTIDDTWRQLYSRYISNTKARNLEFELTFDEAKKLFSGDCFYCGCTPQREWRYRNRKYNLVVLYNGIDRLNNEVGYISNNVVSCCTRCNTAKSNMGFNEFKQWISCVNSRIS